HRCPALVPPPRQGEAGPQAARRDQADARRSHRRRGAERGDQDALQPVFPDLDAAMPDSDDDKPKPAHTLADHAYGNDLAHLHDGDADTAHDHCEPGGPREENPLGIQDPVTLVSVGTDIGSAGTQVIFPRITLRRLGEDLSSRYFVVSRETLYQSP